MAVHTVVLLLGFLFMGEVTKTARYRGVPVK